MCWVQTFATHILKIFFINGRSFNFGGRCKIVILAFSQCKFGGKFHVRLEIDRDICLPSWVFPFLPLGCLELLRGLLFSAKWTEVYDLFVLLNAIRNKKWKNVYSLSLHKEACNIWLMDPAIFHLQKTCKNFVLLKGSGDKCPFCLRWFSSDVTGLTCGVWGGVVTSQLWHILPSLMLTQKNHFTKCFPVDCCSVHKFDNCASFF